MEMSIACRGVAFCPLTKIPPVSHYAVEETSALKFFIPHGWVH